MAEFIQTLEKVNRINKGYQGNGYTIIDGSYLIGRSLPYGNNTAVCWSALYELTTPEKIEEANITSLSVSQLAFTARDDKLYKLSGKLSGSGDGKIYGYFSEQTGSTNQFESYKDLLEKDAFVVKIYQEPFSSNTFSVSFDQPINIKPGTRYLLQLFTKETSRTLWYNWPTGGVKENLTITYNYTTYTKFGDPEGELKDSNGNTIQNQSVIAPKSIIKAYVDLPSGIDKNLIDSVEITWEGAKSGKSTASQNEQGREYIYQFGLDNSTRGSDLSVYAQIKHIGGLEYNSEKVRLGTVKINSLPVITGISFGGITIPAQSASTINITITSSDIDGQDLTYYWKNSNTSFDELKDNQVTVQKDQTFEIYADDGLERGPSFSCKIETNESIGLTINDPPTLTSFEYSYSIIGNDIGIETYEGDGIPTHLRISCKDKIGEWVNIGQTESSFPLTDLFTEGLQGPFEFLQIDGKIVDELGDESSIYSHFLQPSVIELESDENSLSRYYFNTNQWQYELDSSEEDFEIRETDNDDSISGDSTLKSYYLFAKDINALGSNKTQSVKATMKWPVSPFESEGETKLVDIWSTSLEFTTGQFVQFLDKPQFGFSTHNPFQAWLENPTTLQCNVSTTGEILDQTGVILVVRNEELEFEHNISLKYHESSSNSTWSGTFKNRQLYSWPGNTPVEGIYPFEITIKYKADDDSFIQSPAAIISYDFNYVVPLLLPEQTDEISIQEGDIPTISINGLRIATQADLLFELQVDRGDGKGFVQYDNISYTASGKLTEPYVPYVENGELKLPTIQDDPITFSPIGEIADTNNRIWRLVTKIANKEHYYGYSNTLETKVIQHTAPTNFVITNSTWQTQSSEAVLDFTINKNSNDENIEIKYTIKEGAVLGSIKEFGNNQLIFTPSLGQGGPYEISVKVQTTLNGRVKEAISNTFIIYVEGPTISYRAHHIGINSSVLDEDNVLTISPGSDKRRFIYLKGTSSEIKINLLDGSIMGAILDCGSWDNTPGGIIPGGGGGSAPEGLAQVAYTGNIADLVQTPGTEIIIGDID